MSDIIINEGLNELNIQMVPSECIVGETKCDGYNLYECKESYGKPRWVLTKRNAEECGYVPTPDECTVGEPDICQGYDRYRCWGGKWILAEHNSEYCGYIPPYPEVDQAYCPYCGDVFYAPKALEKLFEHVEDKGHIDPDSPWCLFCGAEFSTIQEVFQHWIDSHLDQLTAVPEVAVYGLPSKANFNDEFEVTHIFNLKESSETWYSVRVYLVGQGIKLTIMRRTYTAPDLGRPECFPDSKPLDHTGQYSDTKIVKIPETYEKYSFWEGWIEKSVPEGEYSIVSRCVGYTLNKWGTPGTCSRSKKAEWVDWQKTVGSIYIGEPLPLPPSASCTCAYCGAEFNTREEIIAHTESSHPGVAYTLCGYLTPVTVTKGGIFKVCLEFFAFAGGADDFYQILVDLDGVGESTERIPADGLFHNIEIPFPAGWKLYNLPKSFEIWSSCMYCRRISPEEYKTTWLWRDSPAGVWLQVL